MADNPLRGVHELVYNKQVFTLFYGWDELIQLEQIFGGGLIAMTGDPKKLLDIAVVGLKRAAPDMTAEQFKKYEIPFFTTQNAVIKALKYAYYGDEEKPKDAPADDAKKNPQS